MVALKIQERKAKLNWDYDEDADVLYISFGDPVKAVGLDVGDGVIVRYKEKTGELVGLTIIGLRQRSLIAMGERK
jgi:uncharacterized protein YuzE